MSCYVFTIISWSHVIKLLDIFQGIELKAFKGRKTIIPCELFYCKGVRVSFIVSLFDVWFVVACVVSSI